MDKHFLDFADAFAAAVIDQNYESAHGFLAPWLRDKITPADLSKFVENELKEIAEVWEFEQIYYPRAYNIDGNSSDLETLKEKRSYITSRRSNDAVPEEINNDNFRKWLVIQFMPEEEEELDLDAYFDWWLLLADVNNELKIGYFEIEDPD
jgi:hypothetical protein